VIEELPPLSPQARALLDRERPIPSLPASIRSRALARAHAAAATGSAAIPVPPSRPVAASWIPWAAAAALVIAVGTAAAGIYHHRGSAARDTAPSSPPRPEVAPVAALAPALPGDDLVPPFESIAGEGPKRSRIAVPREELRLLKQARAAVARDDFGGALGPIAEHTRRFRDGRLVEEREALRVKALAGLGRGSEASRAATSFEARFPKSVLLPTVRRISSTAQ